MSGQAAIPARWRDEGTARQVAARSRRRLVLLLFAMVAGLVASAVALLDWLRPPTRCQFMPLFVRGYQAAELTPLAWRSQDEQELLSGSFFTSILLPSGRLDQAALVRQFASLGQVSSDALVVYLSAYAREDGQGRTQILPADADPNDPVTWLPLQKILQQFRGATSRQKLLILDLVTPPKSLRRTVVLDNIWQAVQRDLEAVPDADRLVLGAASPGQEAHASEVLGQSVLAWYLSDGLRGRADVNQNGRITARELANYVRVRVDRWTWRVRRSRQTPFLHGTAADFPLVDLPNGMPRPAVELPPPRTYPDYLQKAWEKSTKEQAEALLRAEEAWRQGDEVERVQQAVREASAIPPRVAPPVPPAFSLALAEQEKPISADLVDAVQQLVYQIGPQVSGQPPAKADELRGQLVQAFLKQRPKTDTSTMLARAALDVAVNDPRGQTLKTLAVLIRQLEPQPEHVETLQLARLAELDLPATTAQRVLETLRGVEQASARPRLFDWFAEELEAAANARHEVMVVLQARGYASLEEGEAEAAQSAARTAALLAQQDLLNEALAVLDHAQYFLPQCLLYRERAGLHGPAWSNAIRQAVSLSDRLAGTRRSGVGTALEDLRRQSALLQTLIEEIGESFTPDFVRWILHAAGATEANPGLWRRLEGLLATTLLPPIQRATVWSAAYDLARRLEQAVRQLDREDGVNLNELELVPKLDAGTSDPAEIAVLLAELAGATAEQRQQLHQLLQDQTARDTLERTLHLTWRDLPRSEPESNLWGWLADRYRYLARDYTTLGVETAAAEFYNRAAAAYRPWLRDPREIYAEILEINDLPRLSPGKPISAVFDVRANSLQPATLDLRFFAPDREWLTLSPDRVRLPAPGFTPTVDGGYRVPLRVELRPGAGEGKTPPPQGILGRVRLDGRRAFHQLIPVPLTPRSPQLLLSTNSQTPTEPLSNLRLRTLPDKQNVYLYLTNPIDKVWDRLQVRLHYAGQTRETAVFGLAGLATKPILFPASPAPAAPVSPPPVAGAASPTPPASPALPTLEGPLTFEVVDVEKNEVVTRRTVSVELADPVEYVSITQVRYDPSGGRNRLSVSLRLRHRLPPPEVHVELGFPPFEDGGATYTTGTLKGTLPADLSEITLFADGVSAPNHRALFYLSADGWARAFLFEVTLSESGAVTPRQLFRPEVRPHVSPYALSSSRFPVPVEADNAPPGIELDVTLGRLVGDSYHVEVREQRASARERRIGFTPHGPGGALVFETSLKDWLVTMDTTRIRGIRELRTVLRNRAGQEVARASRTLVVGDQAPTQVQFVDPPTKAWNQVPLSLQARGTDPLASVKEAHFFLGKPINDKPPPGVALIPGVAQDADKTLWSAQVPVPATKLGPTDVSVQFVNQFGLSSFATISVDLEATDPAKSKIGTIQGKVLEGDRPQSGLTVYLSDEKRAERGRQVTGADGSFVFRDVPPGKYRLGVVKPTNNRVGTYPRKPTEFLELAPGATATADLILLLP